jgi:hypothetical protein
MNDTGGTGQVQDQGGDNSVIRPFSPNRVRNVPLPDPVSCPSSHPNPLIRVTSMCFHEEVEG